MKLKRHRSQLCLQQSFDTINEEEEDSYKFPVSAIEKLETIEVKLELVHIFLLHL